MDSDAGRGPVAPDGGQGGPGNGLAEELTGPAGRQGQAGLAGLAAGVVPAGGVVPADAKPGRQRRLSHRGGIPAQERELGAQGRQTVRRLLEAGMAEFGEKGFQAARVDDVVRRARTSHGTFYLYFKNKEDLFRALLRDVLHDMEVLAQDFPVVTPNQAGRAALRRWVGRFCDTYAAHAAVLRVLAQAEVISDDVWIDGLQELFRVAEAMTTGMTSAQHDAERSEHAELTAVACLMMLERVNFLFSVEVRLPREEMIDRISAIIFAAFRN